MATLQLKTREDASSAGTRRLRRDGVLPMALIAKGGETQKVQADRVDARKLFHDITGVAIFDVEIDGGKATRVIMKDVQRDPVSRQVNHLTVMEIHEDDVVKVSVPIVIEGVPDSITKKQATLIVPINQLEMKAMVKNLPDQIIVDVSKLGPNDKIVVGDLKLGEGTEFLHSDQTVLASTKQLRGMAALDSATEESDDAAEGESDGESEGEGGEAANEEESAE
ncbi:MAG: 50S ribosomal protein L25 [Fimbriimonadaceae bacterium]